MGLVTIPMFTTLHPVDRTPSESHLKISGLESLPSLPIMK